MRVRVAALGLTAITVLALPACSTNTTEAKPVSPPSTQSKKSAGPGRNAAPLSSAALEERLLDVSDLGAGYARKPERPARHDDVTVLGCPALNGLGGDAAMGGSLDFPAARRSPSPTATRATRRSPTSCTATPPASSPTAPTGSSRP